MCFIKLNLKYDKGTIDVETPSEFPDPSQIETIYEPIIDATIITPNHLFGKHDQAV